MSGSTVIEQVRAWWDADAAGYDDASGHNPTSPGERAAWSAALARALPPPPSRVLDVGAGTGFLALAAARQSHEVTALDVSGAMLARLSDKARAEGLAVATVEAPAHEPPPGPFDAVMERHLLWTLPDPVGTLEAWRRSAPRGRVVVVEGLWGQADPVEALRGRGREALRRLLRRPADHHGDYPSQVVEHMPLAGRTHPDAVVDAVVAAGWRAPSLTRLNDVEWARRLALPPLERLLGVHPVFVVTAHHP